MTMSENKEYLPQYLVSEVKKINFEAPLFGNLIDLNYMKACRLVKLGK
jgi:hypothetical protein